MKTAVVILAASALASAQAPAWGQCGGTGWTGPTTCCIQSTGSPPPTSPPPTSPPPTSPPPTSPPPTSPPPTSPPPTSGGNTCGSAAIDQLVGYGAGTTGGGSGAGVTVTSCDALRAAVANKGVIRISGTLTGCGRIDILGDTTLLGVGASSGLRNGGFRIRRTGNVIIRNLNFRTPAPKDDVISLDNAVRVWVDHCNLSSEGMVGGKDDYDGLLDISHASDFVTVSWTKFSDHWKGSLIGHSDNNAAEDTGKLRVTYHHNLFSNVNSRLPSVRFGTGHFYSSCYENNPTSGINSRMGARVLVEQTSFTNNPLSIVTDLDSDLPGNAVERNNLFVNSPTRITQTGSFTPPYSYTTDPVSCVCSLVKARAGTGVISV
ncbi:pectate lyase B [Plectosphaerella plurivora]|uniref:Pectate lyase B n=1 Tax=Plectosphaerella plurivora TaxID=936078 RepID=A0A9P8VG64_9PEZI|nr:pectate lyase B [Plectosphaerella plurivora]